MAAETLLPFVGRSREVELLRRRAESVTHEGRMIQLVRGPAGIGKTRLITEAVGGITAAVVWVRCWDDTGPLWAWEQVLDQLGCTGHRTGGTTGPERSDQGDRLERFTLLVKELRSVARVVDRAVGRVVGRVVVVIDDAHLCDHSSLLFTRFLARARPSVDVLVIVTARSGDDVDHARRAELEELAREADEFVLGRLGHDDVVLLLAAGGVDTTDTSLVDALVTITGGLPLAVERTVLGAKHPDDLRGVPDIDATVNRAGVSLTAAARVLLGAGALHGPNVTLNQLCAAAGCSVEEALAAVDAGRQRGLVAAGPDTEFSFVHELVREVMTSWLSPAERIRVHRAAVDSVLAGASHRLPHVADHAVALAGLDPAYAADAIDLLFAAAEMHRNVGSLEAALDVCEGAARLAERSGAAMSIPQRLAHANAALDAGRLARARPLFERVAAIADAAGDPQALADAAAGLGGLWLGEHRVDADAAAVRALQERALAASAPGDRSRALRLQMRLAAEAAWHTPTPAALDEVDRLLSEMRTAGSPSAMAEALSMSIHAMLGPEYARARVVLADEMTAVAAAAAQPMISLLAQCWKAVALEMLTDERAGRARRALELRCLTIRCASIQFIVHAMAVGDLITAGRFDEAEADAATCFEFGQSVGDADASNYYATHLALIRYFQGRHGELAAFAHSAAASPTMAAGERALATTAACFAAHAGDRGPADRIIAQHRRSPDRSTYQPSTWLVAMHALARVALDLADVELGKDVAGRLEPYRGLPTPVSMAVAHLGPVDWSYGLAMAACGDLEAADQALNEATLQARMHGHAAVVIITSADRAAVRHRQGRVAEARQLLGAAIDDGGHLDMTGWVSTWSQWLTDWGPERRADAAVAMFERIDAHRWRCTFEGRSIALVDTVGMRHLALLCSTPDTDVAATRLAYFSEPHESSQPVLDHTAIDALRDRVAVLRRELDEGVGARGATEDELDSVTGRLLEAMGLGESRRFIDAGERARTSVRKAITRAIDKVHLIDPSIATHLSAHVQTGHMCRYRTR